MSAIESSHENPISKEIVDAAFKIHSKLGPGLLESVYEVILAHELKTRLTRRSANANPNYLGRHTD